MGAASWLESELEPGIQIGLELGRTISHLLHYYNPEQKDGFKFAEVARVSLEHSGGIAKYNIIEEDLYCIKTAGALGDAPGRYFNRQGQPVSTLLDDRVIGLSLMDLKQVPWSTVVAGGHAKHQTLRAALLGGFFNMIITDIKTARYLLEL